MSENVVRTCRCLPSGTNACTVWRGGVYILCGWSYLSCWPMLLLQIWGLLIADFDNVKQLIVKDVHMTPQLRTLDLSHYELLHIL